MKANELRIGNLVTDEWFDSFKKFITVECINDKGINLTITDDGNWSELAEHFITPEYDFEKLRGIPLTEEILLKCGFVSISHLGNKELVLYVNEKFNIEHIKNYGIRIVISNENDDFNINLSSFVCYYEKTDIVYLHQLQNLYFALTGQELNTSGLI